MAQYLIYGPEEYMECPYDKTHMIRAMRFPYHLIKCRKNHRCSPFVRCPLNARHEMPQPLLRHHLGVCPDRALIELDLAHAAAKEAGDDIGHGCTDLPTYKVLPIPSTECWDEEASRGPGNGFKIPHLTKFKLVSLAGAGWTSCRQVEKTTKEEICFRRPAYIRNNNVGTIPAIALNYSVGIGRGGQRQMNAAAKESGDDIGHGCTDLPTYKVFPIPSTECWDEEASRGPGNGFKIPHLTKFKLVNLAGAEWSSCRQMEKTVKEEICFHHPAYIPNNNVSTIPADALNYSAGIGRGGRRQMNGFVTQEPDPNVMPGRRHNYGRGRGILKFGILHQEPVNGIYGSTVAPLTEITLCTSVFNITQGSLAMRGKGRRCGIRWGILKARVPHQEPVNGDFESAGTIPTRVFLVGKKCPEVTAFANQEPVPVVKQVKGRNYGKGRSVLKPRILHQKPEIRVYDQLFLCPLGLPLTPYYSILDKIVLK